MKKEIYPVVGMHCASCKFLIETSVQKMSGVKAAAVNYGTEKLTVEYDETKVTPEDLSATVSGAGSYKLVTDHSTHAHHAEELKQADYAVLKKQVIITGIIAIPFVFFMLWMMYPGKKMMPEEVFGSMQNFYIVQFLLSSVSVFIGGKTFVTSAFHAMHKKTTNMDTLVSLGILSAWIFSSFVTFFPTVFSQKEVYFEAAVIITFFILLGRLLEARAKGKASMAIKALLNLGAKDARVEREGKELSIPVSDVLVGDIVIVKPGEKVPVDGIVIEGTTTIDESMLTGESIPVDKAAGDKAIGATINLSGYFKYKAEKVGTDTMLAQIIKIVEEAQNSQAPIQKLADKISSVFVPIVLVLAFAAFVFWLTIGGQPFQFALYVAVTILIIACPCALGLATPTAVMVSSGKAASRGILIKDVRVLELARKIDYIVFDKTGTLTNGFPEVKTFDITDQSVINAVYSLESMSHHPLAAAVASYLHDHKNASLIEVENFKDMPGLGIVGTIQGKEVAVGSDKLLVEKNIQIPVESAKLRLNGQTVSHILIDSKVVGLVGLADKIKESAVATIKELNSMHITPVMLTGDHKITALAIAKELGIDNVISEVLPSEKALEIKKLQENGAKIVAMVGDGINDAPALVQADIGIAMGTGTDVAIESGDIVLVKGTLDKVVESIHLSQSTLKVIKQNLFWAFGYNVIAIPVAAGMLYPIFGILLSPIIAGLSMALSSVSVVSNSLRIKYLG